MALAIGLTAYAGAKIEWSTTRYDFGAFNESSGPATAVFTYKNTGDEPLVITGARANCGCTKPTYTAEVLQPGETGTLNVTYDPAGRPGRFEKKVYVDSNTEPKRSTLTICGVSVGSSGTVASRYPIEAGPMRMAHPAALLGTISRGHVKSIFESGYNSSVDTLRPVITEKPKWLDVSVLPESVGPGEQVAFNFYVNGDKIPEWDLVMDTVGIKPTADSPITIRMPVVVTVNEDFSNLTDKQMAESPALRLEKQRLEPVEMNGSAVETNFTIHNDGKTPLKIRRIYTRTEGVNVDVRKDESIKPGKSRTFKVGINPSALKNKQATAFILTIISNDPLNPKTTVTILVAQ